MKLLTAITATIAYLVSTASSECTNYGPVPIAKGAFYNVEAHADMGFYAFSFGAPKSYAFQSFNIKVKKAAWLSITDCFCPGDTFQVFDNGVPLIVTQNDPRNNTKPCEGEYYSENAWTCFTDFWHAKSSAIINPGYHNITIAAINSTYGGGTGFIRIDTSCAPPNSQPLPCCLIEEIDNEQLDYDYTGGRLCNQMVSYP